MPAAIPCIVMRPAAPVLGSGLGSGLGLGGSRAPAGPAQRSDTVGITGLDYDAFERTLGDVQAAYSNEDIGALRAKVTPEMLSYFSEDLAQNASRGVINRVSDVKLLNGDLSEAWREGGTDYATVAMRFSLHDWMIDRTTGQVVDGDPSRPQEVTEFWTFRRSRGGPWMLSGDPAGLTAAALVARAASRAKCHTPSCSAGRSVFLFAHDEPGEVGLRQRRICIRLGAPHEPVPHSPYHRCRGIRHAVRRRDAAGDAICRLAADGRAGARDAATGPAVACARAIEPDGYYQAEYAARRRCDPAVAVAQ